MLKSGKVLNCYYYIAKNDIGVKKEIPLGTDLNAAKRKWAELDCSTPPIETGIMRAIFDCYAREIIPTKAPGTQRNYTANLAMLRRAFDETHIDEITPQDIATYRRERSQTAVIVANREIALFSAIFNYARENGFTRGENPCKGVRRNKEKPREYYADDEVWDAVLGCACQEMRDAMDLAYLTGQRPADVLKMRWSDIRDGALEVVQDKTGARLRIVIEGELLTLLTRIRQRPVAGMTIIATSSGERMSPSQRRARFEQARTKATEEAEKAGKKTLADRIRAFQMRDIRAKAASDTTLDHASAILGHTNKAITKRVYHRRGEIVKPIK